MSEQISIPAIAVTESEYRQIEFCLDIVYEKNDFSPIELDNLSGNIVQADKHLAFLLFLSRILGTDLITDCCITDRITD